MVGPPDFLQVLFLAIFGVGSKLDSGSSFVMMTLFLGGVLHKLITFHSLDIIRRKTVSYCVKGLLYCTNIHKEIYVIVLHTGMQGDINICKEIYFIVLHVGMQGDVNWCIKR